MCLARSCIQSGLTNSIVRGNSRGIFIADSILFSKEQRNGVILSQHWLVEKLLYPESNAMISKVLNLGKKFAIRFTEETPKLDC